MTAVVAVAQAGDIKGVVIDKEMNEPLMGASVRIAGTRIALRPTSMEIFICVD